MNIRHLSVVFNDKEMSCNAEKKQSDCCDSKGERKVKEKRVISYDVVACNNSISFCSDGVKIQMTRTVDELPLKVFLLRKKKARRKTKTIDFTKESF